MMGGGVMGGFGGGLGILGGLLNLISTLGLLGGLVFLGVWLFRRYGDASGARQGVSPGQTESPLEILKRRYARGEIDRDEFEQVRETLSS
jgi:putative membrane protein